jgi:hypothetical protein
MQYSFVAHQIHVVQILLLPYTGNVRLKCNSKMQFIQWVSKLYSHAGGTRFNVLLLSFYYILLVVAVIVAAAVAAVVVAVTSAMKYELPYS